MKSTADEYLSIITDDTLREIIAHGDSRFPFAYYLEDAWLFDFHCVDWHWHYEFEFVSVVKGTLICLIGEERIELPEGSGIFINSGVLHRYEAADNVLMPNIVFSPVLLSPEGSLIFEKNVQPILDSALTCQVFTPQISWQKEILTLLSHIYENQTDAGNELKTVRELLALWDILYEHLSPRADAVLPRYYNHRQAKLQTMMQFIHDNYCQPLTLLDIAQSASVSKSSALSLFQSGIHTSPVAYLIRYRLIRSAELLQTTKKPVSSIAEETGFTSAGYFCRKFREQYQMSPNTYRRKKSAY